MPPSAFSGNNVFRPVQPTDLQRFLADPLSFLFTYLYTYQPAINAPSHANSIKIVCVSDTHNTRPRLSSGDVLIHAGDLTINGSIRELQNQISWLNTLPHRYKIAIAGNHDVCLDPNYGHEIKEVTKVDWGDVIYLENTSKILQVKGRKLKVFGAPYTPKYGNWAFQHAATEDLWTGSIPSDAHIVISHGPAKGHVDANSPVTGCANLLREVLRVKPILHVCGHVHKARGLESVDWNVVQWGYDRMNLGKGNVGVFGIMLGAWVGMWVRWALGWKRTARTIFVNAAVLDEVWAREEDGISVSI
jgi:Icc-related predicted phosphoesterase